MNATAAPSALAPTVAPQPSASPKQAKQAPFLLLQQQAQSSLGPLIGLTSISAQSVQQSQLNYAAAQIDHRVIAAYVIIVCMVILLVSLLLKMFVERSRWAQEAQLQQHYANYLPHGHPHLDYHHSIHQHHQHLQTGREAHLDDVATIQNNQNMYKSRTSLSTALTTVTQADKPFDTLDSGCSTSSSSSSATSCPSTGEPQAAAYASRQDQESGEAEPGASATLPARQNKEPHKRQHQQQQPPHQRHRAFHLSHHNLASGAARDQVPAPGPLNPPPPYTISHSHSNHLNNHYWIPPNYFADQCNIIYRPRDDIYGHYGCPQQQQQQQQPDLACLPGWSGSKC